MESKNFDFNFEILNELIRINIWRSGGKKTGVKNLTQLKGSAWGKAKCLKWLSCMFDINKSNNILLCFWVTYEKNEKFNHLFRSCINNLPPFLWKAHLYLYISVGPKMTSTKLKRPDFTPARDRNSYITFII